MTFQRPTSGTLVLYFKRPKLGFGKQRLAATIGAEKALSIAECLLDCAIEDMVDWQGRRVFAVEAEGDLDWAKDYIWKFISSGNQSNGLANDLASDLVGGHSDHSFDGFDLIAQTPGNLGQRLNATDRLLRKEGAENIYFIGSDAPVLTPAFYKSLDAGLSDDADVGGGVEEVSTEAAANRGADILLATSNDGGVTLMGGAKPWPDMQALPWSTERLRDSLEEVCRASGLAVRVIDGHYDIDTYDDLKQAVIDLRDDMRPMRQKLCRVYDGLGLGDTVRDS